MAVTKQTYTAASTWTAAQLADLFRSAFIDAGLMTDWFDSFTNTGIENRVLRVINDGSKTYGTVYYWFMFTTAGGYIQTTLGWNATTHVPTGTQYFDWFTNATNTVGSHRLFFSAISTTTATLTRYTSAINTNCTWFVGRSSTTYITLLIPFGTYNATAFIDQNKMAFNGAVQAVPNTYGAYGASLYFTHAAGHNRRTFMGSAALRDATSTSVYVNTTFPILSTYAVFGNVSNAALNNYTSGTSAIILPTAFANTNTSLAADSTPVVTSIMASAYLPALPADFGMTPYYASNAIAIQDTLVVTAASEEWEMLSVSNNAAGNSGVGRMAFVARTVG